MKKLVSVLLAAVMLLSLAACGGKDDNPGGSQGGKYTELPTIDQIKLGEDYQDITATVKILTNRTDIVDTKYKEYAETFKQMYPNITVEYEAVTDYEESLKLRLTTGDWGDICFISSSVAKSDMGNYFIPLGKVETLDPIYNFIADKAYDGTVYGIANGGNADGVAYNIAVAEKAGYSADKAKLEADPSLKPMPATPDEFLQMLQDMKDKTDAIPLYTNFADAWCVGAWDAYVGIASTGDQDYRNYKIAHMANPFSDPGDGTGAYNVYKCLYESVARGLVEEDPMSTDWEGCKGMINRGEIGVMVLGSWVVAQFQQAGDKPEDIGYMPFPITVKNAEGKRVTSAGGNYSYGINSKTNIEQQIASMLYVKWLLDASPIFNDEGCIPARKDAEMPAFLASFDGIELLSNNPAPEGHEDDFDKVNLESEVGINNDNYPDANIVEHAMLKDKTLTEIMDEWNAKWTKAQEAKGMEIEF